MQAKERTSYHTLFLIAAATSFVSLAADIQSLWSGGEVPAKKDLRFPEGVMIHKITPRTPEQTTGRIWRKGADVIWHKGILHASFGWNGNFETQGENSPGESCAWLTSGDEGKTWGDLRYIARGDKTGGISHGVFLSREGRLWSFNGAFTGKIGKVRTLAFLLDEESGVWEPKGEVVGKGFWALQKPMKLPDGNWIMSGARVGDGNPAAVAISHGDDLTKWDLFVIPQAEGLGKMWGESALIRDGERLINIARYGSGLVALVATSDDWGRTWTPSTPSNLPMTTSKPYAGRLSTGQPYLVCTTAADVTESRNPLTIAVGAAGAGSFSRVFQIDDVGAMMYPGAYEHDGKLYIAYTRHFAPQLAVVPVSSLAVDAPGLESKPPPEPAGPAQWSFNSEEGHGLLLKGKATTVDGVEGKARSLDGRSLFVVENSANYAPGDPGFTLALWVNPYAPGNGEQQILAGKNRYSQNQREWGVMIDRDGRFRLYIWQGGWKTITAEAKPKPGHWRQVGIVVQPGEAQLWVDGKKAGSLALAEPIARTGAPLTFGGIDDAGNVRQTFFGAIDEIRYTNQPLPAEKIAAGYQPHDATLPIPDPPERFALWDDTVELSAAAGIPELEGVEFHSIKAHEPAVDGYQWLHGVGLIWHKGKLYASFGHNRGHENTRGEQARMRVSDDGGSSWGEIVTIASSEGSLGVSHGVFLSHQGSLWSFNGVFYDNFQRTHTRAYRLDEALNQWMPVEIEMGDGFWPLQNPVRMDDGNWIMAGARIAKGYDNMVGHLPAVAISQGEDFTRWQLITLECHSSVEPASVWGESTVIVDGKRITNIARWGNSNPTALVSESKDYGRTWTPVRASNLPMAASKPHAGILSSGQRYLVCTTTSDSGNRRSPLTIAVSRPGEKKFSHVFTVRPAVLQGAPDSHVGSALSYPCAVEHEGKLYVGYSNSGGRGGNFNSAELAVVPVAALAIPDPFVLWEGPPLPKSAEIPVLQGVEFSVVKPHQPDKDGGNWILGTALCWHKGRLYSSFGFNSGHENTATEEARGRISDDGGKTWGDMFVIDPGEGNLGVSHGVFLSHKGTLWTFNGAFYDKFQRTHTRAYTLDENTGNWSAKGVVVDQGFWPLNQPVKMDDGNWIMPGARVAFGYENMAGHPPAVAISHGDDFTKWDLVVIPVAPGVDRVWGESAVIVDGKRILNISRWGGQARALAAVSEDYGRTWTPSSKSNLPMATSKPCAGTLSTGQNYLICTTTADTGGGRAPLTIALNKPGEKLFSELYVIRHAVCADTPGPSGEGLDMSYPYAVEHDGRLYVGYAIKKRKTAEMAVIPISSLAPAKLWTGGEVPATTEMPILKGVEFSVIKPYEFQKDGYRFHHGVALAWHGEKLYATYGINRHGENMGGEEAVFHVSADGGKSWGPMQVIESGTSEPPFGISHGVLLSRGGELWAFHGAFGKHITDGLHTRAYLLNERDGTWQFKGRMLEGFWPLQEPLKMEDGNWIMSGARPGDGNPAAVAISRGDDLKQWELVVIPKAPGEMWGESSVIVQGRRILNIARYHGKSQTVALVAESNDYGRTWTQSRPSNMPMAASKPYTGTLSTGQSYLICSSSADGGNRRAPLTIALTRPGEQTFSRLYVIRHSLLPDAPGESHAGASLAYPYAIERDGRLYVGYSNSGGGVGRVGEGRQLWNNNSIEMAVIPLSSL